MLRGLEEGKTTNKNEVFNTSEKMVKLKILGSGAQLVVEVLFDSLSLVAFSNELIGVKSQCCSFEQALKSFLFVGTIKVVSH